MRHVILGQGNLGTDLKIALEAGGHEVRTVLSKYPMKGYLDIITYHNPEYVWNTIGGGSVDEAAKDFTPFVDVNLRLVSELAKLPKHIVVINFSTNFVANPLFPSNPDASTDAPGSLYALSKSFMEQYVLSCGKPLMRAIRVANLYGKHFQNKTFPGKLIKAEGIVKLPLNQCNPTPTDALAEFLALNLKAIVDADYPILHAAPEGSPTVADWGREILGDGFVSEGPADETRPVVSALGSFAPWTNWHALWNEFNSKNNDIFRKKYPWQNF